MRLLILIIHLLIVELAYSQNNSSDLYLRAEKADNSGQHITAIDLYSQALKLDSFSAKAYLGRAMSYHTVWLARNEKDNVMFHNFLFDLKRSFQLDSTNSLCNFWIATETGLTHSQAITFLNRAIRYCKDNEAYYSRRANCLLHLGQFQSAIEDINQEIKLINKQSDLDLIKSLNEDNTCFRALCYAKLNNLKLAEKDLNKVIESGCTKSEPYLYLGTIKALRGEYSQALEIFRKIINRNPYVAVVYLFIGNTYCKMNEQALAEKYWLIASNKGIRVDNNTKNINYQFDYFIEDSNSTKQPPKVQIIPDR